MGMTMAMAMTMPGHAAAVVDVRLSGAGELVERNKGLSVVRLLQQRSAGRDLAMRPKPATCASLEQGLPTLGLPPRRTVRMRAATGTTTSSDGVRWWEKDGGPNFHDVHSTQEFVDALSSAGEDKLVVVEFYASWCGSCRALYPKLCKLAAEHLDVQFVKVNLEDNKPMCKSLNIKVLPYFHFYRGSEGLLEEFSCSLSKISKLRDAIAFHNTSIGPPVGSASSNDEAAPATAYP